LLNFRYFYEHKPEAKTMTNLPSKQAEATPAVQNAGLVLAGDPTQNLQMGQKAAKALMDFAKQGGAVIQLQGKNYLKAEGWLFLARAFGLTVRVAKVEKLIDQPLTFQAVAEVINSKGEVIGQGVGFCGRDEKSWAKRPVYALASMAQTRATSKALRGLLSWVAVLAGCEPTPGEEIIDAEVVPPSPGPQGNHTAGSQPGQNGNASEPATDQQIKAIYGISKSKNLDPVAEASGIVGRQLNKLQELTKSEASDVIKGLQARSEDKAPF
jgi:hypothetical protein